MRNRDTASGSLNQEVEESLAADAAYQAALGQSLQNMQEPMVADAGVRPGEASPGAMEQGKAWPR